jgi:Ca-activated chloride channel family protein
VSDFPPDPSLDAELCDVPLPGGFALRLKRALARETGPSDEELDAALVSVAIPERVLLRLHEIPADAALDEELGGIDAPPALIHALRRPTWRHGVRYAGRRVWRMALAASWFMAISVALAATLASIVAGTYPQRADDDLGMVVIYDGPLTVAAETEQAEPVVAQAIEPEGEVFLTSREPPGSVLDERPIERIAFADPTYAPPKPGPVGQWTSLVAAGLSPLDDAVLLRYGVLGAPQYADDRLPELIAPMAPAPAGIEPPPVRGYDRAFFLKHRVFPPLSPSASPKLSALDVPLVPGSDVLGRLERTLAEGRLPDAGEMRTESLLAAMDYLLADAPAGKLAIRTAAGPSLFGAPGTGLIFVGVQAGSFAERPQAATHLVLAIDLSHSMGSAGRLESVQAGVRRLVDQLTPRDRLSLVVFREEVVHVVEAATRDDAGNLGRLLDDLTPRGGTNLAAGIQHGVALAMSGAADQGAARRLVLVTDSRPFISDQTRRELDALLAAAAEARVRFDVLDVSERGQIDPLLTEWTARLSGDARQIDSSRQMTWSLLSALSGGEPVIARDARLKVRFNPANVAAYRLIGHEANALADLTPPAIEAEFAAGESAVGLVEVWLQGEGDDIGVAELTWNDPATGKSHRLRQRISRVQFAATLDEAPLPLVQAALAAQVGEVLRGAHDVLIKSGVRPAGRSGLAAVAETARAANPRLRGRPDVVRLLELVDDLRPQGIK